ncbi:hypothetical protein ABK040_001749 [Willaertia magna]
MNEFLANLHLERMERSKKTLTIQSIEIKPFGTIYLKEHSGYHIGSHIWNGSIILLNYLLKLKKEKNIIFKNVIELGSGVGLTGIGYHFLGHLLNEEENCKMIVTDQPELNNLLNENINCNFEKRNLTNERKQIEVRNLSWNKENCENVLKEFGQNYFNCWIGADIVYNNDINVFNNLIDTIRVMHDNNQDIVGFLSYKERDSLEKYFFQQLQNYNFTVEQICTNSGQYIFKITK